MATMTLVVINFFHNSLPSDNSKNYVNIPGEEAFPEKGKR